MTIDKYRSDIIVLIKERGPLGVNAIQRELGCPLSTLQKYLHRQTYFRINEDKKWDLPENVTADIKSNTLGLMTNVVENSILLFKSQLEEMVIAVDNALVPIGTLKKGINSISLPVATEKSGQSTIDPRLMLLNNAEDKLKGIFKAKKDNIPQEYRELLFNYDQIGLVLKEGEDYAKEFLEQDIYELLMGKNDTLSDDTIQILKDNQKGV